MAAELLRSAHRVAVRTSARYRGASIAGAGAIAQGLSVPRVAGCQTYAYFNKSVVSSGYFPAR